MICGHGGKQRRRKKKVGNRRVEECLRRGTGIPGTLYVKYEVDDAKIKRGWRLIEEAIRKVEERPATKEEIKRLSFHNDC